jgi:TatD DNase family protein
LAKNKDCDEIIKTFFKENKKGFLNIIWTSPETNLDVLEISNSYENVFCSVWIHPCDIYDLDLEKAILGLENNILKNNKNPHPPSGTSPFRVGRKNENKIVAIWECWLDYYWLEIEKKKLEKKHKKEYIDKIIKLKKDLQKIFFKAQIELAKKYDLPIIIHNRESKDDVLNILKETSFKNFIFHCYSENLEYAKKLLKFSPKCRISFSWIVTFKNAEDIQETAKSIPLENILVETDSPYLTPDPFRWKQENEPSFTKYVLEKIINLRDEESEIIEKQIFENSKNIFWLN